MGVEVRGEGTVVGALVSQRLTRFSICGDIPGFLLAVCVCACVHVCGLCMCEALIHLDNTFSSLPPNTYASLASSVETRSSVPLTLSCPVILLNFPFLLLLLPPPLTADYC